MSQTEYSCPCLIMGNDIGIKIAFNSNTQSTVHENWVMNDIASRNWRSCPWQHLIRRTYTFRNCLSDSFRENLHIYGPYDFHVGRFVYKTITLCFLWGLTGYTYVRSLDPGFLETTDISALLTTNHTFVYMLSWIVLFEKFVPLRVKTSVSVGHVVCYSDSFLDFKHDFASQRLLFRKKKTLNFFLALNSDIVYWNPIIQSELSWFVLNILQELTRVGWSWTF